MEFGPPTPEMTFAYFFVVNVHYGPFSKLQGGPSSTFQITAGSVIAKYYSEYDKMLEGLEDQLMLDNDEIAGDVGDTETAENAGDIGKSEDMGDAKKAENVGDGEDTRDAGEAWNTGDAGDVGNAKEKEAEKGNNRAADKGNQKTVR